MLVGLKFDSNYSSDVYKIMKMNKEFIKPLHMANSCDSSNDEYYMTIRVFNSLPEVPGRNGWLL